MENFALLMQGFQNAFNVSNLMAVFIGGILGLIVGVLPGIGAVAGVALLLPLTYRLDPTTAIILLAAIYYGTMYGGSFSSILLNIPGEPTSIMTAIDGYEMTKKRGSGKALFASNISSFIGGTIGIVILTILGPALADVGLKFGPAEIVSLLLLSLTSIGWLLGENPKKGLISTCVGVLLALIGMDPVRGLGRFTFGNIYMLNGIGFVPLSIGMFGFSQVMDIMINRDDFSFLGGTKLTIKESILNKAEIKAIFPTSIRTGLIGTFLGCLPGVGATIATFISYMAEKKMCKNGDNFGKGAIEGVAAAESANNAAAAGAFAPLLSLGIPGSGTTAILLGGLMLWGLKPGPLLFAQEPDFVWGLIASMYIGNIFCIVGCILCIPFIIKLLRIPSGVMAPIIIVLCTIGAYSENNSMFDVMIMVIAGVVAYLFELKKYPVAPLLLAFVLTSRFERSFVQAFQISEGNASIFFTKPISLFFLICTVILMLLPIIIRKISKKSDKINSMGN